MPSSAIILCLLAVVAIAPLLPRVVHAGGFYDGSDTYIGGPFSLDCGEMVGRSDGYSNWEGSGGRTINADFWITDDQCMNVMTGGVHYWCSTNGINQGDGFVTTCNYT
ncbi:hypothetical protein OH77DRAFT_1517807 [Trametes cingulata]|nr:hypothetical protein OH77DRAFT_1517807 [Trametes cingulata]